MAYKYQFSEHSNVGKVRAVNEDTLANTKTINGHLFIVCDGMGGAVGGKTASTLATKSIIHFFNKEVYSNKKLAIKEALLFANNQIYQTAQNKPSLKGMGTTACVLLIENDSIYYGHVGDSRIYLRTEASLHTLTRDHSYVNQLIEKKEILIEEAFNHPNKNRILQALGVKLDVAPDIVTKSPQLLQGDELLICSDGLNDMLTDEEILLTLIGNKEEKNVVDFKLSKLIEKAIAYGGKDNISTQLIQITESPFTERIFEDKSYSQTAFLTDETIQKENLNKKYIIVISALMVILIGIGSYFLFKNINIRGTIEKVNIFTSKKEKAKIPKKEPKQLNSIETQNSNKVNESALKSLIELQSKKSVDNKYPTIKECGLFYESIKEKSSPQDDDVIECKGLALKSALHQIEKVKTLETLKKIQNTYESYFGEEKRINNASSKRKKILDSLNKEKVKPRNKKINVKAKPTEAKKISIQDEKKRIKNDSIKPKK